MNKWYLLIRNKLCGTMEVVATFVHWKDASDCCTHFNNNLKQIGDTSREYGVSNNPMIWQVR